ncbi:MAG: hypothetical protein JWM83_624 [Candidatus Angelobacter sp.]|nr:hypothetical protein [Candidatus Angelobacter sp.]
MKLVLLCVALALAIPASRWIFGYAKERFDVFPLSRRPPAQMRGKVTHHGSAVAGVNVRLVPTGELSGISRIYTKEFLTDLNGSFFFKKLLPGTYKLIVLPTVTEPHKTPRLETQVSLHEGEAQDIELRVE